MVSTGTASCQFSLFALRVLAHGLRYDLLYPYFRWQILLQPYHSILIFFTTSALAHIYPEVRFDAIKVLNLLLDVCSPSLKLDWTSEQGSSTAFASSSTSSEQNHSQRVLECYLSLLHVRSGIATNGLRTDMTPTASLNAYSCRSFSS